MGSLFGAGEVLTGFILFKINKEEFAIEIKIVHAILKAGNYNNLVSAVNNNTTPVIEYKNEDFHLLNLHHVLGYSFPNNITDARIILLNLENHKVAIIADNIKEFVTANNKARQFFEIIPETDKNYISGKITYEDRNILVPNLNKIFRDELISHQSETLSKGGRNET